MSSESVAPPVVPDPVPGSHRRFVEMLHEVGGVLWEMDAPTWRFTFVSERAERVFGYPVRRWYDEPTFWQDQLLHPDDREWCIGFCSAASGECRNHAFVYRARTADDRVVWIKDVVCVVADEKGSPVVMRGVMVDVTDEMEGSAGGHGLELDYDAPELSLFRAILTA